MRHSSTVFNQFLQIIPHNEFNKIAKQLKADRYAKHFKAWNLLTVGLSQNTHSTSKIQGIQGKVKENG